MQILAKVLHRLEKQGGIGKQSGKPWASIEFVVEYDFDQKFPKKAVLQFFGAEQVDKAIQELHQNTEAYFDFDIDASEYNGRWFQKLRCYKYQLATLNMQPSAPVTQQATVPTASAAGSYNKDELPF